MQTMTALRRATGHITVIQERRFLLMTDDGRGFQFSLAHDASPDVDALRDLQQHGRRVAVEYDGDPGLATGVAHVIEPL